MPGKYIYGIIESSHPVIFKFSGIDGSQVYAINHQKLAAVVSDTELQEIDPTRKNVHAHTVVQDELLKNYTLLPMSFGMVADSKDKVRKLLEKNYQEIVRELERFSGKIEVGLKVFWDRNAMISELQGESGELTRLKAKINAASSPVERQSLLVGAGKLVEKIAMEWKAKYTREIYFTLKQLSLEVQSNDPLGVKNILNASFLIDRFKEKEFQEQIHTLDAKYQGKVNLKYVGPLPPYSFVNLKLPPVQ
jgi:hypothetical protein